MFEVIKTEYGKYITEFEAEIIDNPGSLEIGDILEVSAIDRVKRIYRY